MRILFGIVLSLVAASTTAADRRPGWIRTSDGVEMKGEVWFSQPEIKVYEGDDAAGGRFVRVAQDEIASITFSIKSSSQEKEWRFKNAGSDEKEYTDKTYPVVELKSETKTRAGQVLKGHVYTQPVMVRVQDRENPMDYDTKKFLVKYQFKGDAGTEIKDVVYVTSITFDAPEGKVGSGDEPKATGEKFVGQGSFSGSVKGIGKIEMASAYGLKRGRAYEGKVDGAKGTFEIHALPEDVYDVWLMTDKGIYVAMSDQKFSPEADRRELEADDLKTVHGNVHKFRDFFDQQAVLALKGDREMARALVWQRRSAPLYDEEVMKGEQIYRLDVWPWHMRQTEWHIDASSRANMFRYMEKRGTAPRPIIMTQKLKDIVLGAGEKKTLELNEADVKDAKPFPLPSEWK
jgi:hypothetical protein